jgi:hypothetical protein
LQFDIPSTTDIITVSAIDTITTTTSITGNSVPALAHAPPPDRNIEALGQQ